MISIPKNLYQAKISHFVDFDWVKCHWQWLEWCIFRVQGMPNPMAQVSSPYDKWFLKNQNFRERQTAKNFIFCWFWLGKMHQNGLSGTYLGFEACQIQWSQVSSLYDKWFLKNQNFRQKFHILLILTGKNASKWLEWCIFRVTRHAESNGTGFKSLW